MKVLVIGASGTIGSEIVKALAPQHEVVTANYSSGDVQIDITNKASINAALATIGKLDAIICAAGHVAFNAFDQLTDDDWQLGINSRLMGQINLTQIGSKYLNQGGSITLTSGIIADFPIAYGTSAATLNGAIYHFVKSAALEVGNGIRINAVSPSLVTESIPMYGAYFQGFRSIDAADLAQYYVRSVTGIENGKVYKVFAGN